MFADWKNDVAHVKQSFGELGKISENAVFTERRCSSGRQCFDAKTRELIALAVAVTTRCESCIGVHARQQSPERRKKKL